jgi:hypothetical protein
MYQPGERYSAGWRWWLGSSPRFATRSGDPPAALTGVEGVGGHPATDQRNPLDLLGGGGVDGDDVAVTGGASRAVDHRSRSRKEVGRTEDLDPHLLVLVGRLPRHRVAAFGIAAGGASRLLTVVHPADVAVIENADGFCGFGRHGDADRREVTGVGDDLSWVRRHGDGRLELIGGCVPGRAERNKILTLGRVGTGRGAGLTTSPFPRPARRTRRARLHAPGAPLSSPLVKPLSGLPSSGSTGSG